MKQLAKSQRWWLKHEEEFPAFTKDALSLEDALEGFHIQFRNDM